MKDLKVSIIAIETLCGRITPAGFGSKRDRVFLEITRENTDASLIGAGSLREGDPEFRIRDGSIPWKRLRAIITNSGELPEDRSIFKKGPSPIIFCPETVFTRLKERFSKKASVVPLSKTRDGMLDLKEAFLYLERHGAGSLLIEGGGMLNYHALKQGVVHELLITLSPKLIGSVKERCMVYGKSPLGSPFMDLELKSFKVLLETGEIFLKYRIKQV